MPDIAGKYNHNDLGSINPVAEAEKYGISVYEDDLKKDGAIGGLFKDRDRFKILIDKNLDLDQKRLAINRGLGHYLMKNGILEPAAGQDDAGKALADASGPDGKEALTHEDFTAKYRNAKKVTPKEVEKPTFEQMQAAREFTFEMEKVRQILNEWRTQQNEDRGLRRFYGTGLLIALLVELLAFTAIFVLFAIGVIRFDTASLSVWIGALVIEVIGLVAAIAKGLFQNTTADFYKLIQGMFPADDKKGENKPPAAAQVD